MPVRTPRKSRDGVREACADRSLGLQLISLAHRRASLRTSRRNVTTQARASHIKLEAGVSYANLACMQVHARATQASRDSGGGGREQRSAPTSTWTEAPESTAAEKLEALLFNAAAPIGAIVVQARSMPTSVGVGREEDGGPSHML